MRRFKAVNSRSRKVMKVFWILFVSGALPITAAGQPFTGTWKVDLASAKFSTKARKTGADQRSFQVLDVRPAIHRES